jgi:SAM-dependent methyltransferase
MRNLKNESECPLCGHDQSPRILVTKKCMELGRKVDPGLLPSYDRTTFFRAVLLGGPLYTCVQCERCGFIWVNPRTTEEGQELLHRYYTESHTIQNYYKMTGVKYSASKAMHMYEFISIDKPRRILDFGGAWGYAMKPFLEKGCECHLWDAEDWGDWRDSRIKFSQGYGYALHEVSFDLVILSHVLEHIPELNGFCEMIYNLLDDDKWFYVEVPNINREWAKIRDPVMHINFFNKNNLQYLIEGSGFKAHKIEEASVPDLENKSIDVIRGLFKKV